MLLLVPSALRPPLLYLPHLSCATPRGLPPALSGPPNCPLEIIIYLNWAPFKATTCERKTYLFGRPNYSHPSLSCWTRGFAAEIREPGAALTLRLCNTAPLRSSPSLLWPLNHGKFSPPPSVLLTSSSAGLKKQVAEVKDDNSSQNNVLPKGHKR